jgi:L,D-transpeptidase catalytic domain
MSQASEPPVTSDPGAAVSPDAPTTAPARRRGAPSDGQEYGPPFVPARVAVHLQRAGSRVDVGRRVTVIANLRPFVSGERVRVELVRNGKVIKGRTRVVRHTSNGAGQVELRSPKLIKPGHYRARAIHRRSRHLGSDHDRSGRFTLHYPALNGGSNDFTALLNDLLNASGYRNAPNGRAYSSATRRAVLAFRKTNNLARITSASSAVFRTLAAGDGEFKPKYPGAGRHVEVDISRQVMALISHGKAEYTYHVSTGAPATPTVRGHFHFYRREPGFNSHGMYYSVYFIGGYATHGYASVPTYNASHGCVRNPIPDSVFIYNWVSLGMSIYVYG